MDYLKGLNEQQKEAVLHTEGPLLIIAGAGAGKTKTITHRIAHLIASGVAARQILAVTFTNKAAAEMRERVHSLLPENTHGTPLVSTFHSLGVRLLREFHEEAGLPRGFAIWDRDDSSRAVKRALEKIGVEAFTPKQVLSAISRKKGDGVTVQEFSQKANHFRDKTIAQVWDMYEKTLREEGALDFDDLLARTLALLQKNQRVLDLLRNRWAYITIDEYQDTNQTQYEMARLLAGTKQNLCVVGDIDQSIYSWRGADIEHLLSFEKSFPSAKVVLLEQNYRSTRTILTAANGVIAKNKRRKEKNLFTENETGDPINMYGALNEVDEAWYVGQTAQQLVEKGNSPKEIAILYRENFMSRAMEEALLRFGVPYRVLGVRFFERKEVKDILSYLRAAMNPQNKNDWVRIVGVPPRGIGKTTVDKILAGEEASLTGATKIKVQNFQDTLAKMQHAIVTLPASDAVRFTIEASGIEDMLKSNKEEGEERMGNLRELVNLAVRFDGERSPTGIELLLEDAALQSDQDQMKDEQNAVSLMTVHASKGLEFDTVFIVGLEQGLFPSIREEDSTRDDEEERRLFYVALTRARRRLYLSYARERMKYGSRDAALPSEFLLDIDQRLIAGAELSKPKRKIGLMDDLDDIY